MWLGIFTIVAIIAGPILAIQVEKFLERRREDRNRRIAVFKTLMVTRGMVLSPKHIEALNAIDIEFSSDNDKDKKVRESWKAYLDQLGHYPKDGTEDEKKRWGDKNSELLVELLSVMCDAVGYHFDKTHIKRAAYVPERFFNVEFEQDFLRRSFVELFSGQKKFPIEFHIPPGKESPPPDENQEKLQQLMIEYYEGNKPLRVVIEKGEELPPEPVKK